MPSENKCVRVSDTKSNGHCQLPDYTNEERVCSFLKTPEGRHGIKKIERA